MDRETNKNSIKMKLLGAIASLGIASVLLVTGTLAWFTVSTAPDVTQIRVNVTTTQNFEIARATTGKDAPPEEVSSNDMSITVKDNTWGQTVTFGEETDEIEINLPVTIDGGTLQTVTFDETSGRTNGLTEISEPSEMNEGVGFYEYEEKKCAAVMGIWLRTNTTGEITASIGEITVEGGREFNPEAIGVAIKLGESGEFIPMEGSGSDVSLGTLEASREGTYGEIVVYMNGDTTDGKGVVAYDVGGDDPVSITIDKITFKNSNVEVVE